MKRGGRHFTELSHLIIGCAIEVHRQVGPGLLETTYRRCFTRELVVRGVEFEAEVPVVMRYKGVTIECAYRIDVLVDRQIVVELKSIDMLRWIHEAEVLTYMRHSGIRNGLLINFNARRLVDGLRSYAT